MSDIDDIIANDVIAKITAITTANGYANDVSSLDGWMVHYASDLLSGANGLSFPAVAVQPLSDTPTPNSSNKRSNNSRVMRLIGAVSTSNFGMVNKNINSLLLDVRKSLAFDPYNSDKSKAFELTMGNATFNLPDSKDQYAFFEMDITIKYIENWM